MAEYPSETFLKMVSKWDVVKNGTRPLIDLVIDEWHWEDYAILKGKTLQLHTGGWSGNEDIIMALEKNWLFWSLCWVKSERGGHYTFEIKEVKKNG